MFPPKFPCFVGRSGVSGGGRAAGAMHPQAFASRQRLDDIDAA
jgi:hypothetical protein